MASQTRGDSGRRRFRHGSSPSTDESALITITAAQRRFASVMTDVLVYAIVLNLFVEYAESVIIDSFTISILTAVLLKLILDAILALEHQISAFFGRFEATWAKVTNFLAVWAVLFGSKFLILEAVDLVFGDHVELGGFLMVIAIVVAMMVSREVVGRIYRTLGKKGTGEAGAT